MGLAKILLPALALASGTFAQSSQCSGTTTIQGSADATSLSSCPTFSGSVHFAPSAAGSIQLDGVKEITGDLSIKNAVNLTTLEADELSTIGGTWTMTGLTGLDSLSMPYLENVNIIMWNALTALQTPVFTRGISRVNTLEIVDTQLGSLDGFNLSSAGTINLANNEYLKNISMPITTISDMLILSSNGQGNLIASFPNLTSAGVVNLQNCSSVDLSSLQNTTNGLVLSGNTFSNFSAPQLTSSGGLSILNNNNMKSMSFPQFQMCSQQLRVENNTDFTGTISFPQLTNVRGAARFLGTFSGLTTPKLNTIRGTVYIRSTKAIPSVCTQFQNYGSSGVVQGSVDCVGMSVNQGGSATGSMPSGTSSPGTHKSGASTIAKPAFGLSAILAGLFGLLL